MQQLARAQDVVHVLSVLSDFFVCVDGGWGVDALLGRQTRTHADLDLIVDRAELESLTACMVANDFDHLAELDGLVYASSSLRVDLHPIRIDERGYGHFDLPDDQSWPFPPAALNTRGSIEGVVVRCLSIDAQIHCHTQGYPLTPNDVSDLMALQEHFGCVLPLRLYREGGLTINDQSHQRNL